MALTNLRVRLARLMVGSCMAERLMVGSCVAARLMVGNCVAEKHTQSMQQLLNLVCAVCTWKSGRLEQIVDIPVPQIEEELVEANQLEPQERTQQHLNEPNFIVWNSTRKPYFEKVPQP